MSHSPSTGDLDPIPTRVGWSIPGDHYWFGRLLGAELAGRTSVGQLLAHAVGADTLAPEALAVLDDLATVIASVADPRIWPLKLGRVVALYGNGMAAVAAVELAFDSDYIGPWTCRQAAQLLVDLRDELGPEVSSTPAVERAVLRRMGPRASSASASGARRGRARGGPASVHGPARPGEPPRLELARKGVRGAPSGAPAAAQHRAGRRRRLRSTPASSPSKLVIWPWR